MVPRLAVLGFALFVAFSGPAAPAQTRTLKVAAASDLQPVMPALAFAFEKKTGVKVEASFGSSASLAEQIISGAPFDVFLGADFVFPEKVVAANLAASAPKSYAKGTLVVFARKDSPLQPLHLEALTDPRVRKIAVGDQFHAPYGRAAYAALEKLKMMAQVKSKLVVAENVAQAAQFVVSGNAQVGLISLTLAASKPMQEVGSYVLVPAVAYPDLVQYGVVMKNSGHRSDGDAFLDFVRSEEVQGKLKDFGLDPIR